MQDHSIVIKLFRNGLGKGPEYKITIYDSGRVVYEGVKNVKIKDKIETSLDEEKIVTLLENLKESGLFNINQKYDINETSNRPFTRLVVEMPGEAGTIKKRSVVHYDDDPIIPNSVKNFENKIDEIVESYRWVKIPKPKKAVEKPKPVKASPDLEKPVKNISLNNTKKTKKKNKYIVIGAAIIIVLCLIFFILDGANIFNSGETTYKYDPPQILMLYTDKSIFNLGDEISINFEYDNVTHNNNSDISGLIKLYNDQELIESYSFSNESLDNYVLDSNDSWPLGNYTVVFDLKDKISGLSTNLETSFIILKEAPEIIVFTPASYVNSYQDYNPQSVFYLGDTLYAYVEYTGINTTNDDTECNIYLKLNITGYNTNNVFWSYSENKTDVGNKAHYWTINTDNSWVSNIYNINIYIYDYNTGLSVSDSSLLVLKD